MHICQYMHADRGDTVRISLPSCASSTGNLRIEGRGDELCIFPPADRSDAEKFLTSLIERATELREEITKHLELSHA